ncbi:hypothetical protein [Cupriavidus consociatus]|uniref:hypothetical protein n=1 Tax=Cupriavidus consociatus TaxID=2821357 RepID=UPI001AE44690|nr:MULTISPECIES: hypothetical protein [unclassified Cupriavidus]MBP0620460.1 hypothetical protein [Cupriavidus sp. LEh25]MDK2657117.1 hypothetical protein [Cupriavidus sp. LEh21]
MQNQRKSADAMLPTLGRLHREVRTMSRRVHRQSILRTLDGVGDYARNVSAVINDILDQGDAHERVVCFASAVEFGIPMHHQSERCRLAAVHTGSSAMRVLYWTAVRRMRSSWPAINAEADRQARPCKSQVNEASKPAMKPAETVLCRQCEALRSDARTSHGHDALHPLSAMYFRLVASGVLTEACEHKCRICSTRWTQHRPAASLFVSWSISRQAAGT